MAQSCWTLGFTISTMNPHHLRLLLGPLVLCNVLLAAPHKNISGVPSEVAQNKEVSKGQKFIISETATSEKKKSVYGDAEKPLSITVQITDGDTTYGDQPNSGEKQGSGETAGLKVETDKTMNLAPVDKLIGSPPPSARPSEMPGLEEEEDDEGDDEYEDDDDAEAEEAQEADDDYDAAEAAEEADDDNGGDNGEDK